MQVSITPTYNYNAGLKWATGNKPNDLVMISYMYVHIFVISYIGSTDRVYTLYMLQANVKPVSHTCTCTYLLERERIIAIPNMGTDVRVL